MDRNFYNNKSVNFPIGFYQNSHFPTPDTGTPTLLQRPVDRPTLFLRLYPGGEMALMARRFQDAVPLRLVSFCRGNNAAAPVESPFLSAEWQRSAEQFSRPIRVDFRVSCCGEKLDVML
ncbi:hypothetical protein OUZ56_027716 [Daphnia magna]|uniref:Uncharacterized protein n=1 Tax=Daphnia magna TaxID=35525 RepID=A0ABR0B1Q4_9CRUS|nr:hypothetical protein OUZ56_027716 [Daphnia magna]